MSSAQSSTSRGESAFTGLERPALPWLSTLAYRSRTVEPLSDDGLQRLVAAAQARNRAESITSLMVHDEGSIFQWLEGPPAAVSRVWQSIRNDARHTAIEILGDSRTPVRFFGDSPLTLSRRSLRADAHSLSAIMAAPFGIRVAAPLLAVRRPAGWATLPIASARVPELAELLVADDPAAAFELMSSLYAAAESLGAFCASVLEPSARRLGDQWCSDDCSELDVTIGMCRLQTALRRVDAGDPFARGSHASTNVVLLVPQPGEPHLLGSALDAALLWQAGWETHCEYPATDDDLQGLLAGTWFDVLDLSMSPAFCQEHRLSRLATTITQARKASLNPQVRVIVGGRVFVEQSDAGQRVGADAASASSVQVAALIRNPAAHGA